MPDVKAAHQELAEKVMNRKGVTGTAIGRDGGRPCLKVYVSDASVSGSLPEEVGGFRVIVEQTGRFKRL